MPVLSFVEDSYDIKTNKNKEELMNNMEKSLETIMKWLKKSGMKVNQDKTIMCWFNKHDTATVNLN